MANKNDIEIYLWVEGKQIRFGDIEENLMCNTNFTVKSVDDFYEKINGKYEIDEETSSNIEQLIEGQLENSNDNENKYDIKHWVSNRSFGELIDMYDNGEIVKPDMQREFVWDSNKCSRLIESILLGLPIPPLFFMELEDKRYEIIDGFQRLTAITNYVNGVPWNGAKTKRTRESKLSGNINSTLKGKSFKQLDLEQQRIIKRSTIPLIEFKQMDNKDLNSKYLIFERINTGSERLNQMQIRKSLAHGEFISSVYEYANKSESFASLFSAQKRKTDAHVEAFLRVYVMMDIYYNQRKTREGISNILNDYCEKNRDTKVKPEFYNKFEEALNFMYKLFGESNNMFKRSEKNKKDEYEYIGNMNICLMEAMMGVYINKSEKINSENFSDIREKYYEELKKLNKTSSKQDEINPFSVSTGTIESIKRRFEICEKILGVCE